MEFRESSLALFESFNNVHITEYDAREIKFIAISRSTKSPMKTDMRLLSTCYRESPHCSRSLRGIVTATLLS